MDTTLAAELRILSAPEVDELPWQSFASIDGVHNKVLWRDATSMAGVLRVDGGHRLGAHTHRVNHHHLWVLDGRAEIAGRDLAAGGYAHIPAGAEHDIDASRTDGCTVFYLYLRPAGVEA